MAFRDITPDAIEPFTEREFVRFNAIGDKVAGIYVSHGPGKFGMDWKFRKKDGVDQIVSAKGQLNSQLLKAGLKPGSKVIIEYKSSVDIGKENPMRVFSVKADTDDLAPIPAAKKSAPAAASQKQEDPF